MSAYQPVKPSRSEFVSIRGLRTHIRHWGPADAPRLVLLHGWLDCSAAFQFTVDLLKHDWHVIAPDWRGNGLSEWAKTDAYWFQEFLADIDHLIDHICPDAPANIVGHSFGGALPCVFAGVRPRRVARVINVEGLGPRGWPLGAINQRYAELIAMLKKGMRQRDYATVDDFAARLQKEFARVPAERIAFMAEALTRRADDGRIVLRNDPAMASNFSMHFSSRLDDAQACWRAVRAPVLQVFARQGSPLRRPEDMTEERLQADRLAHFRDCRLQWLEDTGHAVHLERPEAMARLIEDFIPFAHPAPHPAAAPAQPPAAG